MSVTFQGKDYSKVEYINPNIGNNSGNPEGDSGSFSTMTPDSANVKRRVSILTSGKIVDGGQWTIGRIGARPALYKLRIIINDCYDREIYRFLICEKEQVYANWYSYIKVTNNGTNTKGLIYAQPSWVNYEGQWQWLGSPNPNAKNEALMVTNGGGGTRWMAWKKSAARPALYS